MPVLQWHPGKTRAEVAGGGLSPILHFGGGSATTILQVKDDPLGLPIAVVNDLLRMKIVTPSGAVQDNWLKVTGRDTSPSGYTNYWVVRQSGTAGTFPAGTAVVNYGQSGQGFLFLTSDDSDGPFYSVRTHAGAPWSVQTEVGRFGNLKNSFGVGANNRYGFAAGDYAGGNYLLYNPTDGFQLKAGAGAVTINANGVQMTAPAVFAAPNNVSWLSGASVVSDVAGAYNAGVLSEVYSRANALQDGDAVRAAMIATNNGSVKNMTFEVNQPSVTNGANGDARFYSPLGSMAGVTIGTNAAPNAMLDVRGTGLFGDKVGPGVSNSYVKNYRITSLANNGVVTLVDGTAAAGFLFVNSVTDQTLAIFKLQGTGHATAILVQDATNQYTITAGTAAKCNIYWNAGTSHYELENKVGAGRNYNLFFMGE